MNSKKSQTATEYLILLAVVIVISLIVVGVLGGIPSIGGGTSTSANNAKLASQKIGILNYKADTLGTLLNVQNNQADSVKITAVYINNKRCSLEKDYILKAGMKESITCYGVTSNNDGDKFEYNIVVNYTDLTMVADYSINYSGLKLSGVIAQGSELHTGLDACYGGSYGMAVVPCNSSHVGQDGYDDGTAKSFGSIHDGTIQDLHTGLYWSNASASDGAKETADIYCVSLNANSQGGFTDWRVPNMVELASVIGSRVSDLGQISNPSPNGNFWFPGGSGKIWSSTENAENKRYFVSFKSDSSSPFTQGYFYVWRESDSYAVCVRGTTRGINLVDSPKHFVDVGDGTVIDQDTGLVWQKGDNGVTVTWDVAVAYCNDLSLARYSDWRLPTISESISLIDYSKSDSSPNDYYPNAFGSQTYRHYWTGTALPSDPEGVYGLLLYAGGVDADTKGDDIRTRCVRDH
jgi:uncharacterized protein (UPF0333 family)